MINLGYRRLKTLETDLETCFVEHILDTMMKRVPVTFLYILGIQHMIGSVFSFPEVLKPNL